MNISNEIIKILDDLGKRFGVAIDWSNKNIVPYLQELCGRFIDWQITTSVIWSIICVLTIALSIFLIVKGFKKLPEVSYCESDGYIAMIVVGFFVGAICLIGVCTQVFDICRCIYLPELEIYNYISNYF